MRNCFLTPFHGSKTVPRWVNLASQNIAQLENCLWTGSSESTNTHWLWFLQWLRALATHFYWHVNLGINPCSIKGKCLPDNEITLTIKVLLGQDNFFFIFLFDVCLTHPPGYCLFVSPKDSFPHWILAQISSLEHIWKKK